jgi:hypothetical protein
VSLKADLFGILPWGLIFKPLAVSGKFHQFLSLLVMKGSSTELHQVIFVLCKQPTED